MSKKWMAIYCIASAAVIIAITIFFVTLEENRQKRRETVWGSGFCENCNLRYELKAVSGSTKYYACNGCGKDVVIY